MAAKIDHTDAIYLRAPKGSHLKSDKMLLYQEYIKERRDGELIVCPFVGFISYAVKEDNIAILDLYIRKEERRNGYGNVLFQKVIEIAKQKNKKYITCTVDYETKNWRDSEAAIKAVGFKEYTRFFCYEVK